MTQTKALDKYRLLTQYRKQLVPQFMKDKGYKNALAVPKMLKIVVNIGITEQQGQNQALKSMAEQLAMMTGQKPKTTVARISIASFKLRQGDPIGLQVTLRGKRMWQFFDKFVSVVLPRVKDFQGVPRKGFDGRGSYSMGLVEQIVFPEINYDTIDKVRGFQITFVTTAKDKAESLALLTSLNMPFAKE
jgi:large subunit ribosomal protein L5